MALPALVPEAVVVVGIAVEADVEPVLIGAVPLLLLHVPEGPEAPAHMVEDSVQHHPDQHEIALYKITTPTLEEKPEVSKVIRKYNARIVEVNAVFAIVEKNGMSEEITNLYEELRRLDCVLQFVRSGRVAITTSCFERVNEYLADREAKYRQSKQQES